MKLIALLSSLCISFPAISQINQEIPNNEFNTWDSNTNPQAWSTLEDVLGPGSGIVKQENADLQNGAASMYMETPVASGYVNYTIVSLGNMFYNSVIHRLGSTGTAYNSRPDSVWILYKYMTPADDSAGLAIDMQAADANGNPEKVLNVLYPILPSSKWLLKGYKLSSRYASGKNPDSIYVSFISSASKARTPGSKLLIDGIYFNNPAITGVRDINKRTGDDLELYPNPVHGNHLKFNTIQNLSGYHFQLINANGQKVFESTVHENSVELNSVLSGNYFWLLISPKETLVGKGRVIIRP